MIPPPGSMFQIAKILIASPVTKEIILSIIAIIIKRKL